MTLLISHEEVQAAVTMDDAIAAMKTPIASSPTGMTLTATPTTQAAMTIQPRPSISLVTFMLSLPVLKRKPPDRLAPDSRRWRHSFMCMFLDCVNENSSSIDSSRPMPDIFVPPKGVPMKCGPAPLTQM